VGAEPFRSFRRRPLAVQLIASYLVILGAGGLITFTVGSWRVSRAFMEPAHRTALHDLAAARVIYEQRVDELARTVQLTAAGTPFEASLASGRTAGLAARLERLRVANHFDFFTLTDERGRVLVRSLAPARRGDDVTRIPAVRAALTGRARSATELLPTARLAAEDPALAARARAGGPAGAGDSSGLVVLAAAPVWRDDGRLLGALYGGIVLEGDTTIVDRVARLVYRGERLHGREVGVVALFRGDAAVATTLRNEDGSRALKVRAPGPAAEAVLGRGVPWDGVAAVLDDRYVLADEPIRDGAGKVVGILQVGLLEEIFSNTRDRLILVFFVIAFLGFVAILFSTYSMIRRITSPLMKMAAAARRITAGHLDQNVESDLPGEAGLLAESFNTMTVSLRQMKGDLEEWGRTLEEKVHQRTEELVTMQARVAQAERLASVGMLAAGVAHEINNPLGGILALTSLAVEDMKPDDPAKPNLEEVVRQTERCRDIVKGLLEFSRQSKAGSETVDVNEVLQDTLTLLGNQSIFFNVQLIKDWDATIPRVLADRSQLQQVFTNLLVNAAQAMDERGTITLGTRYSAGDGHVEISIADTGHGIDPETIDRIFDPFFTTKESGKGSGLGLSIAYGIVTKHGGTIKVSSRPGGGSTFTVRFPAAEVPHPFVAA